MPSGLLYGPEKRTRTVRDLWPTPRLVAWASASRNPVARSVAMGRSVFLFVTGRLCGVAERPSVGGATGATKPTRWSPSGRSGMSVSSKNASDVVTIREALGTMIS